MTEREKNGERLTMKISHHRQAKHESLKDEDLKTAYIKGCEDTEREYEDLATVAYMQGASKKQEQAGEIIRDLLDEIHVTSNKTERARKWLKDNGL